MPPTPHPPSHSPLLLRSLTSGDREQWDAFIQSAANGCFMQAWAWADFKELEGYQTFRYGLFVAEETNEKLVGGCIFYFFPSSHDANLLMAPGGPFLLPGFELEGMQLLLNQATVLAKEWGAIALRIEPLLSEKPNYLQGFVRAPVDLLFSETLLIDLRPTEAKILQSMKPKGRYNVRLSQRHGVETRFTTDPQAIPVFYDLFWETGETPAFFW
ncbi:aminoacyltransferase [Kovacikia minuta CCNUW1]|uniref:lipid II:glycine glycyltransferase FemX n=1 Tax=Kovacikia minuta TaxID=2931930 RepID=UPI001CCA61BD|nr:peptidoglycan bridge formation glycyltransferase FemA/FemB family protein [Kovacikia minuta]UBF25202.1 aminoacyltransferase [Kovacikia minuta CCNUW1]